MQRDTDDGLRAVLHRVKGRKADLLTRLQGSTSVLLAAPVATATKQRQEQGAVPTSSSGMTPTTVSTAGAATPPAQPTVSDAEAHLSDDVEDFSDLSDFSLSDDDP